MRNALIALALVAAACGGTAAPSGGDAGGTATSPGSSGTSSTTAAPGDAASSTTEAPAGTDEATSTTTSMTTTRARPDGPDAPDFTLALGQGGEFTLSEEQKPVYMVFWAEW